jgi:ribosomal protein L11 methyltransferase
VTQVFRIEAPPEHWDRLVGELHELGTLGIEERETDAPPALVAYFSSSLPSPAPVHALAGLAAGVRVIGPEPVPERDWDAGWKRGLAPRRIGPIWVRPSWCAPAGAPELVIDPEQAFGTGEHATTRLALELLVGQLRAGDRVLDVGAGSGILGLAALRLGAARAFALDCCRQACRGARRNEARNALRLDLACATLDALDSEVRFDVVVANMLLSEFEPLVPRLAAHARRALVLSGYLAGEAPRVERALASAGMVTRLERFEAQTGETWGARVAAHGRDLQSSSSASSVASNG